MPLAGITRRHLLAGGGALAVAVVLPPLHRVAAAATAQASPPGSDPVRVVLAAYVSTLVPGPRDDPQGTPGALEAGAVEQIQEQVPYIVAPIVSDVSAAALTLHGQPFEALGYADREALLVAAFADRRRSPYHLIALAVGAGTFYGDFRNRVGGAHLGFPGPADGYLATYTDRTGHGQPQSDAVPA